MLIKFYCFLTFLLVKPVRITSWSLSIWKFKEEHVMRKKIFVLLLLGFAFITSSVEASATAYNTGDLTYSKAFKQIQVTREHYWNVVSGCNKEVQHTGTVKTFQYKGKEYRNFCTEFDTKAKLVKYMNEVYTMNAIDHAFKEYGFIVNKGKLAMPNADSGSILGWERAKGKLIYHKNNIRQYQFSVPVGDSTTVIEKHNVTFVKVQNKWLINSVDAVK